MIRKVLYPIVLLCLLRLGMHDIAVAKPPVPTSSSDVVTLRRSQGKHGRVEYLPALDNMSRSEIRGCRVNTIPFEIHIAPEFIPAPFRPVSGQEDGAPAVAGMKEKYDSMPDYSPSPQKRFSPYFWAVDVVTACDYGSKHGDNPKVAEAYETLDRYMRSHLEESDAAAFVKYPVDYAVEGYTLKRGWSSAFANGLALCAYLRLWVASGKEIHKSTAEKLYRAFLKIRKSRDQDSPWVAASDDTGFLWFEEYPLPKDPQMHVINGHIWAIQTLYCYYSLLPSEECLSLIRAGITTVKANLTRYRVPGGINRYSLSPSPKSLPDYGPGRLLVQLKWLHDVTGDPYFDYMRTVFLSDFLATAQTRLFVPHYGEAESKYKGNALGTYVALKYGGVREFEKALPDSLHTEKAKSLARNWMKGESFDLDPDGFIPTGAPEDSMDLHVLLLLKGTPKANLSEYFKP